MSHSVNLMPLDAEVHLNALTRLYRAVPTYRQLLNLIANPYQQAQHDLSAVAATPGRALLGIVLVNPGGNRPSAAPRGTKAEFPPWYFRHRVVRMNTHDEMGNAELVGLIDFRRHWPRESVVYVGLILVAEAWQRQGIASRAWALLESWLADEADMKLARCNVEQFNSAALRFMQHLDFQLTGEATRVRRGEQLVRLLTMEKALDLATNNAG